MKKYAKEVTLSPDGPKQRVFMFPSNSQTDDIAMLANIVSQLCDNGEASYYDDDNDIEWTDVDILDYIHGKYEV
jgi:hypothetical protein